MKATGATKIVTVLGICLGICVHASAQEEPPLGKLTWEVDPAAVERIYGQPAVSGHGIKGHFMRWVKNGAERWLTPGIFSMTHRGNLRPGLQPVGSQESMKGKRGWRLKPGELAIYVETNHKQDTEPVDLRTINPTTFIQILTKRISWHAADVFRGTDNKVSRRTGAPIPGTGNIYTINSPQDYNDAGFGHNDYSGVLVKAQMPRYIPRKVRAAFRKNAANIAALMNIGKFESAGNFDGGRAPVRNNSLPVLRTAVATAILAVAGPTPQIRDQALAWMRTPENSQYCAELVHSVLNGTLVAPQTFETVRTLRAFNGQPISRDVWDSYQGAIRAHNAGRRTRFTELNDNGKIKHLKLATEADLTVDGKPLKPYLAYAPVRLRKKLLRQAKLERQAGVDLGALLPLPALTPADTVANMIGKWVPRSRSAGVDLAIKSQAKKSVHKLASEQGITENQVRERWAARRQSQALEALAPTIMTMAGVDPASRQGQKLAQAIEQVKQIVGTPHRNYRAFRRALSGPMQLLRIATGKDVAVPPNTYYDISKTPAGLRLHKVAVLAHSDLWRTKRQPFSGMHRGRRYIRGVNHGAPSIATGSRPRTVRPRPQQ
jgi:hypothetical protein